MNFDMTNPDYRELGRRKVANLYRQAQAHPDRKDECLNGILGWRQLFSAWGFVL